MQIRKKIQSYFLLTIYFLVALHHSVSFYQLEEPGNSPKGIFHEHEGYDVVHHENHFHVGILHFLGHLFENTNHLNELGTEHLQVSQDTVTKKAIDFGQPTCFFSNSNSSVIASADDERLPKPSSYLLLSQKSRPPNTPLRAPPVIG